MFPLRSLAVLLGIRGYVKRLEPASVFSLADGVVDGSSRGRSLSIVALSRGDEIAVLMAAFRLLCTETGRRC